MAENTPREVYEGFPRRSNRRHNRDHDPLYSNQKLVLNPATTSELRAQLGLDADQIAARERGLDRAFATDVPESSTLTRPVREAGEARSALRLSHLSAHLETMEAVTADQVARYANLRGYASDPRAAAPTSHDPAMWRRHNGCD